MIHDTCHVTRDIYFSFFKIPNLYIFFLVFVLLIAHIKRFIVPVCFFTRLKKPKKGCSCKSTFVHDSAKRTILWGKAMVIYHIHGGPLHWGSRTNPKRTCWNHLEGFILITKVTGSSLLSESSSLTLKLSPETVSDCQLVWPARVLTGNQEDRISLFVEMPR